ncbi:MAG: heme-binding protein [Deltaproteobacteria bacterium]|nr:heme-binding protein [Deltaproteobacteria bacterium]NIS77675.1 heme-binding protein [Deltaproteobacteria bacterium]
MVAGKEVYCFLLALPIAVAACGAKAPEPGYIILSEEDGYEVREYAKYVVAEVTVTGTHREALYGGFRILFDYIDGNNAAREKMEMTAPVTREKPQGPEKIPMTAPVILEGDGEVYVVAFVMPLAYRIDTLPRPGNARISFREVEGRKVAALRFSWYATEKRVKEKKKTLEEHLARDGYRATSTFRAAYYNPPWTLPFLRRNEILVDIE